MRRVRLLAAPAFFALSLSLTLGAVGACGGDDDDADASTNLSDARSGDAARLSDGGLLPDGGLPDGGLPDGGGPLPDGATAR